MTPGPDAISCVPYIRMWPHLLESISLFYSQSCCPLHPGSAPLTQSFVATADSSLCPGLFPLSNLIDLHTVVYVIFRKDSSDHKLPLSQRFRGSSLHTEPNPNFLSWLLRPCMLTRCNTYEGPRFPGTHVNTKVLERNKNIKHLLTLRDEKE